MLGGLGRYMGMGSRGAERMTKAYNSVGSTLKAGWNSASAGQFKAGMRTGAGTLSGLRGVRSMKGLKSYGRGVADTWKGSTNWQRAGMGASYGAAGAAGMAAADFMNPWGLGWGD